MACPDARCLHDWPYEVAEELAAPLSQGASEAGARWARRRDGGRPGNHRQGSQPPRRACRDHPL